MSHILPQFLRHEARRRQRLWQLRGLRGSSDRSGSGSLDRSGRADDPITVYGLFSGASGLGQAARLLADNLEAIGRTVYRVDVTAHLIGTTVPVGGIGPDAGRGPIIWHLNPVEAAEVMVALTPPDLARRTRIGMWLYELSEAPASWQPYVALFDAIWSPSDMSAAAMRALGAHALTVPYCHQPVSRSPDTEPRLRSQRFTVLAMADARSSLARKNITGAIEAFRSAFDPADSHVRLQLKISHLPANSALRDKIAPCSQIELIESRLSFQSTLALIASADVFLSLHRGEGYGLTLVESMQMGVPVIMTDEPSTQALQLSGSCWTAPSHPVPVRDPQGIYSGGLWAEPDLAVAAKHLRCLRLDWMNGALASGRSARIQAANSAFCGSGRLESLRSALRALPMKKAPQPELRGLKMRQAEAL